MLIPLSTENDEQSAWPYRRFVHYGLVLICFLAFCCELAMGIADREAVKAMVDLWSFDPTVLGTDFLSLSFIGRAAALAVYLSHLGNLGAVKMLTSTFLHAGWAHLFSNVSLLWLLGGRVEYAMGHLRYLLFFIFAAIISDCGDVVFASAGNLKGGIGASGAIMAVAGAYIFYFPRANIDFLYFQDFALYDWGFFSVRAGIVIGVFVLIQLAVGIYDYGADYDNIGIWAHVTGFAVGLALARPLRRFHEEPLPPDPEPGTGGGREGYRQRLRAEMRRRQNRWRR